MKEEKETPRAGEIPNAFPLRIIRRVLVVSLVVVTLAGLLSEVATYTWVGERTDLTAMFSLSYEENMPTWFSSMLVFACGVLLIIIAAVEKARGMSFVKYWFVLGLMFLYISWDEVATIHENLGDMVDSPGGVLHFAWVIPATVIVGFIGFFYLKFLWALPPRTRMKFFVAGCIFVGGALGMELPLGAWAEAYGIRNLGYGLIDWVEESMEKLGMTIFMLALLKFLGQRISLSIHAPGEVAVQEVRSDPDAGREEEAW